MRVGSHLFFPDFTLSLNGTTPVWVEIVGYYTPEYLASKLRVLRDAAMHRMIVCVDESLTDEPDAFRADAVLLYRRRIDAATLLAAAERIASGGELRR